MLRRSNYNDAVKLTPATNFYRIPLLLLMIMLINQIAIRPAGPGQLFLAALFGLFLGGLDCFVRVVPLPTKFIKFLAPLFWLTIAVPFFYFDQFKSYTTIHVRTQWPWIEFALVASTTSLVAGFVYGRMNPNVNLKS